jgi:hypothetical protein
MITYVMRRPVSDTIAAFICVDTKEHSVKQTLDPDSYRTQVMSVSEDYCLPACGALMRVFLPTFLSKLMTPSTGEIIKNNYLSTRCHTCEDFDLH